MSEMLRSIFQGPTFGEMDIYQCMVWILGFCGGILIAVNLVQNHLGGLMNCYLVRTTRLQFWLLICRKMILTSIIHTVIIVAIYLILGGSTSYIALNAFIYLISVFAMENILIVVQIYFKKNAAYIFLILGCIVSSWLTAKGSTISSFLPWNYAMSDNTRYVLAIVVNLLIIAIIMVLHGKILESRLENPEKSV